MYIITKNNGKMRTSEKLVNLYITWKVLSKAIQKCTFHIIWVIFVKSYGHLSENLGFIQQAFVESLDSWC